MKFREDKEYLMETLQRKMAYGEVILCQQEVVLNTSVFLIWPREKAPQ